VGKSKRSRKKNQKPSSHPTSAAQLEVTTAEATFDNSPLSRTAKIFITMVVLVILSFIYWLVRSHAGGIPMPTSQTTSNSGSSIQTGGNQPLAPSGSVDLQPTGNAAQAGGIQAGQSL
jgi:hypothetical protein